MKKEYIAPEMEIVNIKNQQQLLTGSDFGSGTKDGSNAAAPDFFFDEED